LWDGNGIYNSSSRITLTNVSLARSVNVSSLGSIIHNSNSTSTLTNVIAWVVGTQSGEKTISNDNASSTRIAYSNIEGCGGSGGWNPACGIDAGNNIEVNPLFVDAANGNLRLQSGSPAINSGDDNAVPAGVTTDRDGNLRFSGLTVDMGAYEFQSTLAYRLLVNISGNGSGQVTSTPEGILCPGDCSQVYAPNTAITLTAVSGASSTFVGWSGDLVSNANPLPLTVMSHSVITATFIQLNAPYFTSTPVTQAAPDQLYSYTITTADPDLAYGDILTITAPTLPVWLTLVDNGNDTATLFGTPTINDVGQHTVVLRVTDRGGLYAEQTFAIQVNTRLYLPLVLRNTP
ncbi:MAG: choice-of-anchor Q domain-containing protein, partial [Armatimonadota bacterium]